MEALYCCEWATFNMGQNMTQIEIANGFQIASLPDFLSFIKDFPDIEY